MVLNIIALITTYLFASIPFIYLLGASKGINIYKSGTNNPGSSNLIQQAGFVTGIIGVLADLLKGTLPVVLTTWLGFDLWIISLASVLAVSGQMWPALLLIKGGRGNVTTVGATLTIVPWALLISFIPPLIGFLWKESTQKAHAKQQGTQGEFLQGPQSKIAPLGVLMGIVIFPIATWFTNYPQELVFGITAITCLIIIRRLTASLQTDRQSKERNLLSILISRLLFDRPIP
ncbi:MAG: glycerol-3-phosphate acyltransferase [SAR202 cluster bacterium]|nr:glycerol-3-phosphate acyltransferase [SAR202 cluster bacterium]|tara:strand:+ start:1927 stop:2622 length:696 start_codon:yes stop_codon:yes gene_type:complete